MRWHLSWRADPSGKAIADNHYNRQNPESDQFVPPGRCVVLVIPKVAVWVTSWPFPEYVRHAWPGAWVNSTFRNESEGAILSSELIREAMAATRWFWTPPAGLGLITFVDERKVRRKRDPGRCYRRAGFTQLMEPDPDRPGHQRPVRTKEEGHLVFQMLPDAMPAAEMPHGAQARMFG